MHKEQIFSASSARHQGTSSGNMKPCPLCLCVVFSCPLLIFPSLPPFPVLRSQAPPGGENGAQPVLMERACPRAKGGAPALLPSLRPACRRALRHRRTRLFPVVLFPASLSFFLPSAPVRLRVAVFAAPCGTLCRERLPHPCGVLRRGLPAACRGIFLSRLSVVSSPRHFLSLPLRASPHARPGVASAIRDSPADSAVAHPQLRSVSVYLAALRPVAFPSDPRLSVVPPSLSLAPCAPSHPSRVPRYPPDIVFHLPGRPSVPPGGPGA